MGSYLVMDDKENNSKTISGFIISNLRFLYPDYSKFNESEFVLKITELTALVDNTTQIVSRESFNKELDAEAKQDHINALLYLVGILTDMVDYEEQRIICYWS